MGTQPVTPATPRELLRYYRNKALGLQDHDVTGTASLVYLGLVKLAIEQGSQDGRIRGRLDDLCKQLRTNRNYFFSSLKLLDRLGVIERVSRSSGGSHQVRLPGWPEAARCLAAGATRRCTPRPSDRPCS